MLKQSALVLLCLVFVSGYAEAQPVQIKEIQFPVGKTGTSIKGAIKGRESISYKLGAEAGQEMRVTLHAKGSTSFNLYAPGRGPGDEALAIGEMSDNRFVGKLPASGVYLISVFLNRAAARRNEKSSYTLEVSITPKTDVSAPVKADFADGLQGGPDFWRVTKTGQAPVALLSAPSAKAKTLMRFDDGAVLRNHGCRMAEGARWCKVELPGGGNPVGWMRGDVLRESAPPQNDARVAGTAFQATGEIPCATAKGQPTVPCRFGVARQGLGKAVVTVFLPGGAQRLIRFDNGVPSGTDAPDGARLSFTHQADLFMISINAERFEIPEAVVNGG